MLGALGAGEARVNLRDLWPTVCGVHSLGARAHGRPGRETRAGEEVERQDVCVTSLCFRARTDMLQSWAEAERKGAEGLGLHLFQKTTTAVSEGASASCQYRLQWPLVLGVRLLHFGAVWYRIHCL